MAISHLTENVILSRRLCLIRCTLDISLSCSTMSSGEIRRANWPHQMKQICPRTGRRRHMIADPGWTLQPKLRPKQRLFMIPSRYVVTSTSQSRISLKLLNNFWYPLLQARPHLPSLKILLSRESLLMLVLGCKTHQPPVCAPWISLLLKLLSNKWSCWPNTDMLYSIKAVVITLWVRWHLPPSRLLSATVVDTMWVTLVWRSTLHNYSITPLLVTLRGYDLQKDNT